MLNEVCALHLIDNLVGNYGQVDVLGMLYVDCVRNGHEANGK